MLSLLSPKPHLLSGILAVVLLAGCTPTQADTTTGNMRMDPSAPMMHSGMCAKCQGMCPKCEGMCPPPADENANSMNMQSHSEMSGGNGSSASSMDHSAHRSAASANIYASAMTKMHTSMTMASSGNADVDFMRGMIPHHQGAIDMAQIALANSSDPVVRKLATEIVEAQKTEISSMQRWLSSHGAND